MLKDKYKSVLALGEELGIKDGFVNEEAGKLKIGGTAAYQYDADRLWDTIKEVPGIRTYLSVDGGMSENLRPMLYDAKYEASIANRAGQPAQTVATIAGSHCESGDILVRDVALAEPQVGDILITPATGAYGHAMANNYNGMPRPPVIFCEDGQAEVVVRRETWDDLLARDA